MKSRFKSKAKSGIISGLIILALVPTAPAAMVPTVRVMIERAPREVRIEGFDLVAQDPLSGFQVATTHNKAELRFRCQVGGKLQVAQGKGPWPRAVRGPLKVSSPGGFVRVDGRRYRDDLYVYSSHGQCIVVNHVDLEKYVAGLLNSEMSSSWNLETLKAQAVAARTYALYQMREASDVNATRQFFDLESTVKDQVYDGAHQERYRALRAIHETKGQVLTFQNRPIKAFYHSTCGGQTEAAERVWGTKLPYIKPVTCGYCERSPRFRWKHELTLREATETLRSKGIISFFLGGLRVVQRNPAGRATEIELIDGNTPRRMRSSAFRNALGTTKLKSTNFEVNQTGDRISFSGSGSGHGVGLCQWGAKTMGEKGFKYEKILSRYYPLATLTKLY